MYRKELKGRCLLMYTTIFLLLLIAFYLLYNLSKKVKVKNRLAFLDRLQQSPVPSRLLSLVLMVGALLLCINQLGFGAGIFGWIVALMGVGGLIVMLAPFHYVRIRHIAVLYVVLFSLEVFFFLS